MHSSAQEEVPPTGGQPPRQRQMPGNKAWNTSSSWKPLSSKWFGDRHKVAPYQTGWNRIGAARHGNGPVEAAFITKKRASENPLRVSAPAPLQETLKAIRFETCGSGSDGPGMVPSDWTVKTRPTLPEDIAQLNCPSAPVPQRRLQFSCTDRSLTVRAFISSPGCTRLPTTLRIGR